MLLWMSRNKDEDLREIRQCRVSLFSQNGTENAGEER